MGNIADNRFIDVVTFEIVDKPESKSQSKGEAPNPKRERRKGNFDLHTTHNPQA